jgi:hypothetical protein
MDVPVGPCMLLLHHLSNHDTAQPQPEEEQHQLPPLEDVPQDHWAAQAQLVPLVLVWVESTTVPYMCILPAKCTTN